MNLPPPPLPCFDGGGTTVATDVIDNFVSIKINDIYNIGSINNIFDTYSFFDIFE
jgi:hypothetical protein